MHTLYTCGDVPVNKVANKLHMIHECPALHSNMLLYLHQTLTLRGKFLHKKKKKNLTSFGQPTRLITCAKYGNVQDPSINWVGGQDLAGY